MSECKIFNQYQKKAEEVTRQINQSQTIEEKVKYAKELVGLEEELEPCFINDDPKCRLERRVVVPARKKVAEAILKMFEIKGGKNE